MRALAALALAAGLSAALAGQAADDTAYLNWTAKEAQTAGKAMYQKGRVGGFFNLRVKSTDSSYNYKLAATWLTLDVVKATVRLQQLGNRLPDAEAQKRVAATMAAMPAGETTVMIEIDPREGSGVIPLDWVAFLEPRVGEERLPTVAGHQTPERRTDPNFAGVLQRDYSYERFWMAFPMKIDGKPAIPAEATSVDLIVRIRNKEGHVTWPLSADLKQWLTAIR